MILVDTNIPLRIAQVGHPQRQVALDTLEQLTLRDNERFAIAPQSLYEMYVVLTRPAAANGGFGMTAAQASAEIAATRALFELLPETTQVYPTWEGLVAKYAVQGKRARDVRLVALMIQHRVPKLLTSTMPTSALSPRFNRSTPSTFWPFPEPDSKRQPRQQQCG